MCYDVIAVETIYLDIPCLACARVESVAVALAHALIIVAQAIIGRKSNGSIIRGLVNQRVQ